MGRNTRRAQLSRSDADTAAYELGELAHVIMDLAQPMHTAGAQAIANQHRTNYENATRDHASELSFSNLRTVSVATPKDAALDLATKSSARYDALAQALDAADHEWSPEVARLTEATLRDGMATTRMLLAEALAGISQETRVETRRIVPGDSAGAVIIGVVMASMLVRARSRGRVGVWLPVPKESWGCGTSAAPTKTLWLP